MIYTIVGLGNPGKEYALTRHNTGRVVLELLAKKNGFSDWKEDGKSKSLVAGGVIGKKMMFVFPNNFMNNSGKSVAPFIQSKKDLEKLVVVYDDLDLPIGRIKISYDRGDGGHNGLASIIKAVKSREFVRIRVGISPHTPKGTLKKPSGEKAVLDFLLKEFKEPEIAELKKVAKKIGEALEIFTSDGKEKMMSVGNTV